MKTLLERMPLLPGHIRLAITDSHDVTGYNDDGFNSTYSYLYHAPEGGVLFEHQGAGCIKLIRTIGFAGELVAIVDGREKIRVRFDDVYAGNHPDFPAHLVCPEDKGSGSAWSFAPIPFRESIRLLANEPIEGIHFFNIWALLCDRAEGLDEIVQAPADWTQGLPAREDRHHVNAGTVHLAPHGKAGLLRRPGSGSIRALRLRLPEENRAQLLEKLHLRATWDGHARADIDAPLGLFFGAGYADCVPGQPTGRFQVSISDVSIELGRIRNASPLIGEAADGVYYCHFPMPFFELAAIELVNRGGAPVHGVEYEIEIDPAAPDPAMGFFTTEYRREDNTLENRDYIVSDMRGWGKYMGCVIRFSSIGMDPVAWGSQRIYLEGNARFLIDDCPAFQSASTGTEEYFNWGWYDIGEKEFLMSFPTHGQVEHTRDSEDHTTMYRFHPTDYVPYHRAFAFALEHGGDGREPGNYASVAFHYKRDVCKLALGARHREDAAPAEGVKVLWQGEKSLVYEGNAQVKRAEMLKWAGDAAPVDEGTLARGLTWTGEYVFRAAIEPDNAGVKLRRRFSGEGTLDRYLETAEKTRVIPGQSVTVAVDGEEAGIWHQPPLHGRNTWMMDEFDLPARLTAGKSSIEIRLRTTTGEGWTSFGYWIFTRRP